MYNDLKIEKEKQTKSLTETIEKQNLEHKSEIDKHLTDIKTTREQLTLDYSTKLNNEKLAFDEKILTLERVNQTETL
jgi:hypothetical protein